jgi:small GTP-binding protein
MDVQEEIKKIEEEIRTTKYNKATQFHIGKLKAKLAKLREEQKKRAAGKGGLGYGIKKEGDATVLFVGFPSVGKSTLLNKITSADSKIGEYDFTTLNVIPGVMEYRGAKIQVLDVPGLVKGASEGRGRGKEILSVVRNSDLVLIMIDASKIEKAMKELDTINDELYKAGFRLNQKPPEVRIKKRNAGGISAGSAVKLTNMTIEDVKSIMQEFKINNAEVTIRENITQDQLIDAIMDNRVYVPSIVVANKIDIGGEDRKLKKIKNCVPVSAIKGTNIEKLKEMIWDELGLMRIYLKKIGKRPDLKEPIIMKGNPTIKDVCLRVHKDFEEHFMFVRVWGSSKFPGQKIGLGYVLKDKDIVEFHIGKK